MKNSVDDTGGPRAKRRPGSRFVCEVCCDQVHLTACGSTIIMACPEHGAWIMREGEKLERIEFA
jgi:hypothetical protein